MDQPPAMVKQCFSNTQCTTGTCAGTLRPPRPDFFSKTIAEPLALSKLLCFRVFCLIAGGLWPSLWWKTFTKWRKLSSCWHNCAVLLTKVVQTGPVSEMRLHSMSALSFLTDNTPTPMAVLLCLVPTSDLLACIYSLHFSFENNHTTVVFSLFTAFPIQFQ